MKKIFTNYDYAFKLSTFYAICAILLYSCVCEDKNNSSKTQQKPVSVRKTFSEAYPHDQVRHVNEKGFHYILIYYNGITTVNYTKDSIEIALLKTQHTKDSLQVEVFKKYLRSK